MGTSKNEMLTRQRKSEDKKSASQAKDPQQRKARMIQIDQQTSFLEAWK